MGNIKMKTQQQAIQLTLGTLLPLVAVPDMFDMLSANLLLKGNMLFIVVVVVVVVMGVIFIIVAFRVVCAACRLELSMEQLLFCCLALVLRPLLKYKRLRAVAEEDVETFIASLSELLEVLLSPP